MKNLFLTAIMGLALFTSCQKQGNATDATSAQNDTVDITKKEWKAISPDSIQKNATALFNNEWMALAAGTEGDMNAMTISWGQMGELWNKPVITVYVSSSRYTYEFMEKNEYFTVTAFPQPACDALKYIGSHSGRDEDKIAKAGLTPEFTELKNPIFKEANLAIECKIIYKTPFEADKLPMAAREIYDRAGMGIHTMYIGEIVNAWVK